jgi:thymidylate synthase (FAD)
MMEVKLLYHTPEPERAIAVAARLCYSTLGGEELSETLTQKQVDGVLKTIVSSGHHSTLEHASYTFSVEGISRSCSHQLVRHRVGASFNQQSQRYCEIDVTGDSWYVTPPSFAADEEQLDAYWDAMSGCAKAYQDALKEGVKKEDARYLLPEATKTNIVVTMNARELLHFFELRCCNRAQWEIRELACKMLELVKPTAPTVFKDAGPQCVRSACKEGRMSCGNPWTDE